MKTLANKYLIIFVFLVLNTNIIILLAQPSAPSVNGLGYAKFVDFPISPFTGTFSYSVPIATVTSGSLSLPISIDYHSGGNKVGDPASNVGLGWNLNCGGSITRTIVGVADEIPDKGYWFDPTPSVSSLTLDDEDDVADGDKDGEPDIFTWNVGGQGGKFYFDRGHNLINISKTDAKIERLGGVNIFNLGFKITLNNGTEFFFTLHNTQAGLYQESDIVEFILTKIRSFDSKDSILLNYQHSSEDEIFKVKYITMPIKHRPVNDNDWTTMNEDETHYIIRQKKLDQIIGTNNKVTIDYSTRNDLQPIYSNSNIPLRVSGIKFENGTFCIEHMLNQSYFKDNPNTDNPYHQKLKLDGIQKISCQTSANIENPISFEYNGPSSNGIKFFPNIYDKNIDHFGYYNKQNLIENNTPDCDMIQNTTLSFVNTSVSQGNANRKPDFNASLKGMLEKVTLPTKGTIEYTYEQNDYSGAPFTEMPINLSLTCGHSALSQTLLISSIIKSDGLLSLRGTAPANGSCGSTDPKTAFLKVYNSSNTLIYSITLFVISGTLSNNLSLSNISEIVANESYRFELSTLRCNGVLKLTYTNPGNFIAPGVRIKQIKISDCINTLNPQAVIEIE